MRSSLEEKGRCGRQGSQLEMVAQGPCICFVMLRYWPGFGDSQLQVLLEGRLRFQLLTQPLRRSQFLVVIQSMALSATAPHLQSYWARAVAPPIVLERVMSKWMRSSQIVNRHKCHRFLPQQRWRRSTRLQVPRRSSYCKELYKRVLFSEKLFLSFGLCPAFKAEPHMGREFFCWPMHRDVSSRCACFQQVNAWRVLVVRTRDEQREVRAKAVTLVSCMCGGYATAYPTGINLFTWHSNISHFQILEHNSLTIFFLHIVSHCTDFQPRSWFVPAMFFGKLAYLSLLAQSVAQ